MNHKEQQYRCACMTIIYFNVGHENWISRSLCLLSKYCINLYIYMFVFNVCYFGIFKKLLSFVDFIYVYTHSNESPIKMSIKQLRGSHVLHLFKLRNFFFHFNLHKYRPRYEFQKPAILKMKVRGHRFCSLKHKICKIFLIVLKLHEEL